MKKTKASLFHSGIALLLCISMFIGSTFAWFSDSVFNGKNIITAGNLDLEMYWTDDLDSGEWHNVEENGHNTIFNYDNWEPGYTDVKHIKLVNAGDLALNYKLSLTPQNGVGKLAEVINVYFAEGGVDVEQRSDLKNLRAIGLLDNVLNGGATANGTILAANQYSPVHPSGEVIVTVAMNMLTTAGNEYQNEDAGEFTITALATQAPFEMDSFGNDYDSNAEFPSILKVDSATAPVTPDNGKVPVGGVTLNGDSVSAFIPEGVALKAGSNKLTLTVTPLERTTSDITVVNNEVLIPVDVHIDGVAEDNNVPIIIDLGEVLPKYLNMGNYRLFHVENGVNNPMTLVADKAALAAHNQFTYDPLTGFVSVAMTSFSEITFLADNAAKWEGGEDYTWYDVAKTELQIANADQLYAFAKIVGGMANASDREIGRDSFSGKTIKLLSDINLNHGTVLVDANGESLDGTTKKIFYPVGYYNSEGADHYDDKTSNAVTSGFYTFDGTFDGNGHTISNVYQNTWEMKGDHDWYAAEDQHYRDGMGIFGRVYGGTIKNLTVDNFESDGEITTTGVIASYADFGATFENIAITNCNPRVYNIGNGGIVGCVGWYTKGVTDKKVTFKNITVDNSNKISALWGSYDVPCGGIVGQYYPTSGQTSAGSPKNAGIYFENCHAAAQMDVNNDVCGNYQYYAYRYAGILLGSVRENETIDGRVYPKMDGITAKDCTVHFGTWNDYYYCEFEKNGHPSYSGPTDYKFSRVPYSELEFTDSNGNGKIDTADERASVTGCKHNHTVAEDNQAVYLPFNNLVTGYGWGVTSMAVGQMEGVTILDREEANSVEKFKAKGNINLSGIKSGDSVSVGVLFEVASEEVAIKSGSVMVSVTDLTKTGITADFTRGASWDQGTLKFNGTNGYVKITIQDYYFCKPTSVIVKVGDFKTTDRFKVAFPNKDNLNKVGNSGKVALGKLFTVDGDIGENVTIDFEPVIGASVNKTTINATKETWAAQTVEFSDTGIVKVTIADDNFSTPVTQYLEVVEAVNSTTAANATANNVVLLNDCTSTGFTVSDKYAFYGNGFKVTCAGKGTYLGGGGMTLGYVNVQTGGVLDNVQVICDIYPNAFAYTSEVTVASNLDQDASTSDKKRYMYQMSAISLSGDGSVVSNCYAYGGRNNIFVGAGDVLIDNTVTECGTFSNIQIKGSSEDTITIKDTTTIQYRTTSKYDSSKVMLGLGIAVGDNESTSNANIVLEGDLKQYNWVTDADNSVSNTYAKTAIATAIGVADYQHTINGVKTVNMGIAYLNAKTTDFPAGNDQRTNKNAIPYIMRSVTIAGNNGYVYSIAAGSNDGTSRYNAEVDLIIPYKPNKQGDVPPKTSFALGGQAVDGEDRYLKGDVKGITARYENGETPFTLDITKLMTASKYGRACSVVASCKDPDGNSLTGSVTLNKTGVYTLEFIVTDNLFYSYTGEQIAKNRTYSYSVPITLTIAEPAIPDATLSVKSGSFSGEYTDSTTDGSKKISFNVLEPVVVTDAGETFNLKSNVKNSTIEYAVLGTDGNGNAFGGNTTIKVTYNSGQILTIVISRVSGNSPGNPKTITYNTATGEVKSTNALAKASCQTAEWKVNSYSFTGCNGKTVTQTGVSFTIAADTSGGGGCVTPDTLITLADGSKKRIDEVTYNDQLLVWNFYTGTYDVKSASALINHGYDIYTITKLNFSDGTSIKVIDEHGFFDVDKNKFVFINSNNVNAYVGHKFAKSTAEGIDSVTLESFSVTEEYTIAYSIFSHELDNALLEDMLSITPVPGVKNESFWGCLAVGENMTYDYDSLQNYIEKYGLYSYEELAVFGVTYEQYMGANLAYLKIMVGEGIVTLEHALDIALGYIYK